MAAVGHLELSSLRSRLDVLRVVWSSDAGRGSRGLPEVRGVERADLDVLIDDRRGYSPIRVSLPSGLHGGWYEPTRGLSIAALRARLAIISQLTSPRQSPNSQFL